MARRAPTGLAVVAACAVAGVWAPGVAAQLSAHRIVPGKSVGRIQIGDRRQAIEKLLGPDHVPPRTVKRGVGVFIAQYPERHLSLFYFGHSNARLVAVSTNDPKLHTANGIRIGATRVKVAKTYPKLTCSTQQTYCDRAGPGGRITRFGFHHAGGKTPDKDEVIVIAVGLQRYLAKLH